MLNQLNKKCICKKVILDRNCYTVDYISHNCKKSIFSIHKLTVQVIRTMYLPRGPRLAVSLSDICPPPNTLKDPNTSGIHVIHSSSC